MIWLFTAVQVKLCANPVDRARGDAGERVKIDWAADLRVIAMPCILHEARASAGL